ncbi:hypothetical protein GCM10027341_04480 [Spirosoma knui]
MSTPTLLETNLPAETSSVADFDFLLGKWIIHNRKLKTRLANSDEWFEFSAIGEMRKILNGLGNIDSFITTAGHPPFEGMALRIFNPQTRLWSIHWADSIRASLDAPILGSFQGDMGLFQGDDTYEGQSIRIRFEWDKTDPTKPVWRQAFSADEGQTWEWNWYMYFQRFD